MRSGPPKLVDHLPSPTMPGPVQCRVPLLGLLTSCEFVWQLSLTLELGSIHAMMSEPIVKGLWALDGDGANTAAIAATMNPSRSTVIAARIAFLLEEVE